MERDNKELSCLINSFVGDAKDSTNRNKKLNLFSDLKKYLNKEYISTLNLCEQILQNKISAILFLNKLYYCYLHDHEVFLFSTNFNLLKIIKIKELKSILLTGKYSIILKFFPDPNMEENRMLVIRTFTNKQRDDVLMSILPESVCVDKKYKCFNKKLIINITKQEGGWFINEIKRKGEILIRENEASFYNKEVYDLFKIKIIKNLNLDCDFLNFKLVTFLFSIGLVDSITNMLFYNINNVKFDLADIEEMYNYILMSFRNHKDSIKVEKGRRRRVLTKRSSRNKIQNSSVEEVNTEIKVILNNSESEIEKENESESGNSLVSEESILKSRPRYNKMEKHSKTNYIKHKVNIKEDNLTKPTFEKLTFNVVIPKYFGKDIKILEINSEGQFLLYKKGKTDLQTYNIQDISHMEGESNTASLNMTMRDSKKIVWLEFSNVYEKYLFKTIIYNHLLLSLPRNIIGNQLKLNVNIMTWNLAGIDVPSDLGVMFNTQEFEGIDIFTIGVQECSIFKIKDWQKHLKTLISYYGYEDVTSIDMCQMFLIVFIKKELRPFVENVSSSYKPMGFAKIIGNKGGIIITFKFLGYQLTFVNCHLAPKPYKVLERNKHAKNLVKSIRIGEKFADFDILADYLFWQGDLNYRIDYTFDETVREIRKNNIKLLLGKDQLIKQRQQNHVFYDFQEPEINFFPTYRRKKGTDEYSNKNNQSPSWCDRVMVKTGRDLDMLFYDSIKNVKHSDHMPVLGKFSIYMTIPTFDDIEKTINQNVAGQFIYTNLSLNYNFTEAFSELDIEPKFPFKLKLSARYFLNKQNSETKYVDIKESSHLENIIFDQITLNFPPQFVFDLPHPRSFNIFFILTLVLGKSNYEIGFAKYSLENIERDNLPLLIHDQKLEVTWRLRKFGMLNLTASYKF